MANRDWDSADAGAGNRGLGKGNRDPGRRAAAAIRVAIAAVRASGRIRAPRDRGRVRRARGCGRAPSARGRGPLGRVDTAPGPRAVAAPDDSEVTAALARDLVKTRTFRSHPTIAKVEEITDGTNINRKTIKVYLKSGSVKEIPDGKIGDPMTVPAATIVAAIEGK